MSPRLSSLRLEARANLRLALPLIAAQLSFVSMGTVDTIFAGQLGAAELAAVAVGSNVWFLVFVMFRGVAMAVSPIVAQRVGAAQHPQQIGAFLRGAMGVALMLGLLWFVLMLLVTPLALWLLELDLEIQEDSEQPSLLGVRRAQMQLAARLLANGDQIRVTRILQDLAEEPVARLQRLAQALRDEDRSEYWELTERGIHFSYLEPDLHQHLNTLMQQLEALQG